MVTQYVFIFYAFAVAYSYYPINYPQRYFFRADNTLYNNNNNGSSSE